MSKLTTILLAIFLLAFFVNGENLSKDNKSENKSATTTQNGKVGSSINSTVISSNNIKVSRPKLSESVKEKYQNWKVN